LWGAVEIVASLVDVSVVAGTNKDPAATSHVTMAKSFNTSSSERSKNKFRAQLRWLQLQSRIVSVGSVGEAQ
jgi:hypothetical protein